MSRTTATVLLVAVSFVASSADVSAKAGGPKKPTLSSMLLTVAQVPTGWNITSSSGSGIGCLSRVLEPAGIKQTTSAAVEFEDNGTLPQVTEKLATYATAASKVFAKIVSTLNACKTVSGTSDGEKATGTVGAMSLPAYGDQSAAYNASVRIGDATADEDVLVARKGTVLVGMDYGALVTPDLAQFQSFIRKALARIPS